MSDDAKKAPVVLHDEPLSTDAPDLLRRRPFAKRVAQVIGERRDPAGLVVALYGPWGEGKTSVLRMIQKELDAWTDILVVEFNPWYFRDEEHLLGMFFTTLAQRLKIKLGSVGDEIGRSLRKYGALLGAAPTELAGIPNPGKVVEAVGGWFQPAGIGQLRERIERGIQESGLRPVVVIDDIDRLDRPGINAVTKLVKLIAGFNYTTYLLAFDEEVVAAALAGRFSDDLPSARDYLEKIVQVPLRLPPADQDSLLQITLENVDRALASSLTELEQEEVQRFLRYFRPLCLARPRTIRTAKRYGNSLSFGLPLLKGEVNAVDFLLIEGVRALYPSVYGQLRASRELLTSAPSQSRTRASDEAGVARQRLAGMLGTTSEAEQHALRDLLRALFPFLKSQLGELSYGYDIVAELDRAQAIGSPNYFERYFQYSIPPSDVPDVELGRLECALARADESESLKIFDVLTETGGIRRLVRRLRAKEDERSAVASRTLIKTLQTRGNRLPRIEGFMSVFESPQTQAAILVAHSLKSIEASERLDLALEALEDAEPLGFAVEIERWVSASEEARAEGRALLSEDEEQRMAVRLAARLRSDWQREPFFLRPTSSAQLLLSAWASFVGRPETEDVLRKRFETSPFEAAQFVLAFAPMAYSMETGLGRRSEIERHSYDAIARLIDPDILVGFLRSEWTELGDPNQDTRLWSAERKAASQFVHIHSLMRGRADAVEAQGEKSAEQSGADATDDTEGTSGEE